jgi:hypothetical protein
VGVDDGNVYRINNVFKGTPTLAGSPWPVNINVPSFHLSSPVLDGELGLLMIGSASGSLYQIDVNSGIILNVLQVGANGNGGANPGIVAPPIVDVANGTTFVVSADNGTNAVLEQVDTASLTELATAAIGLGAASPDNGVTAGTALNLFEPAVTNSYFSDPSTGTIRICGTSPLDTSPWQYGFPFIGRVMQTDPSVFAPLVTSSTAARCTAWTEFFNPNVAGGTDYFFFGLTQDCTDIAGGPADGCVAEVTGTGTDVVISTINGGPSGIVIDNFADPVAFPQASSIYFTAIRQNTAYKFTQDGLQ